MHPYIELLQGSYALDSLVQMQSVYTVAQSWAVLHVPRDVPREYLSGSFKSVQDTQTSVRFITREQIKFFHILFFATSTSKNFKKKRFRKLLKLSWVFPN